MVLIDSIYINKGGGKILLEYFIDSLIEKKIIENYFFLFDTRMKSNVFEKIHKSNFIYLQSSEKHRKLFYKTEINKFEKIFCFSNVPPPIKIIDKPVFIYFHNTLLLDYNISNVSFFEKSLLFFKRIYIKVKNNENYKWIVQSSIISNSLSSKIQVKKSSIEILPIFDIDFFKNINTSDLNFSKHFLYVADSSHQKNHNNLLNAWEIFSQKSNKNENFLHLTLDESSSKIILNRILLMKEIGYNIINHGNCSREEIKNLYSKCNFLVYPSLAESFGLPLIEATAAGCKILASNLPYVFQVIEPSLTFNPIDSKSIANALLLTQNEESIKPPKLLVENKIDHLIKNLSNV